MSFTWAGRQLTSAAVRGKATSYTYNSDGICTSKTMDGVTTDYLVDGSTIVAQRTNYNTMWFPATAQGLALRIRTKPNSYLKNAQGDVTGIVDSDLNVVVEYTYDAWGKLIGITGSEADSIGRFNPFLYRGYYHDAETGLYYLNSRYYDPQTGRYLNADSIAGAVGAITSHNVFSYCGNNPVSREDPIGHFWNVITGFFTRLLIKSLRKVVPKVAKAVFGASSTTVFEDEHLLGEANGGLFSIKSSASSSTTLQQSGDSSKPISVYSKQVINAPEKNAVGLKLNISKATLSLNLGPSDTGITLDFNHGNTTDSGTVSFNFMEAKLYNTSSFTTTNQLGYDETYSTAVTVNGDFIAGAILLFGTKKIFSSRVYPGGVPLPAN